MMQVEVRFGTDEEVCSAVFEDNKHGRRRTKEQVLYIGPPVSKPDAGVCLLSKAEGDGLPGFMFEMTLA
jgi:hypothetical protein